MTSNDTTEHIVTAVPVKKLRDGIISYRFACSCGRVGNGYHRTPEIAVAAGHNHVPEWGDEH